MRAVLARVGAGREFGLDRGHAVVLVLLACLGVGVALVVVLASRPDEIEVPTRTTTSSPTAAGEGGAPVATEEPSSSDAPAPTADAETGSAVTVHVAGQVARPGLVRLPAGSRVNDALQAAGGALPGVDLSALNLARLLSDGEQVAVGIAAAAGPQSGGGGAVSGVAEAGSEGGLVDLNRATLEELDTLPGVGPVLAQRILDWRDANGQFSSVDELQEVSGIGPKVFATLAAKVRV